MIISMILGIVSPLVSQDSSVFLYPVERDGKWGYIDSAGTLTVDIQFERASAFNRYSIATVRKNEKWGIINTAGAYIISPRYKSLRILNERFVAAGDDRGQWGLANISHGLLSPVYYDEIAPLDSGKHHYFQVQKGELTGVIDTFGNVVVPAEYHEILSFPDPYFEVRHEYSKSLIHKDTGRPDFRNIAAYNRLDSTLLALRVEDHWTLAGIGEGVFTDTIYQDIQILNPGFLRLQTDSGWYAYDLRAGKILTNEPYDYYTYLADDYLKIHKDGMTGIIHRSGKILVTPQFSEIRLSSHPRLFETQLNQLRGLINNLGEEIFPPQFTRIHPFRRNITHAHMDEGSCLINVFGEVLLAMDSYEKINYTDDVIKIYHDNGELSILKVNAEGRIDRSARYADVQTITVRNNRYRNIQNTISTNFRQQQPENLGWYFDRLKRKWGKLSDSGDTLVRPVYEQVIPDDSLGLSLMQLKGLPYILYLGMRSLKYLRSFGLYDDRNERTVALPLLWDIKMQDFKKTNVARAIRRGGRPTVVHRERGVLYDDLSYVGPFKETENGQMLARVNKGGFIRVTAKADHSVMRLKEFCTIYSIPWCETHLFMRSTALHEPYLSIVGGDWGFMNEDGRIRWLEEFDFIEDFTQNMAFVKKDGKWGVLNDSLELIFPCIYEHLEYLEGKGTKMIKALKFVTKKGFVNENGEMVIYPEFQNARPFHERLAAVKKDGKWGFIDEEGQWVVGCIYSDVRSFKNGRAAVKKGYRWGFIDRSGRETVKPVYYGISDYQEGFALARSKKGYIFLDKQGVNQFEQAFRKAEPFENGLAVVRKGNRWGVVDSTGQWVWKPRFRYISNFNKEGIAVARRRSRYGIINSTGEKVIRYKYAFLGMPSEGMVRFKEESSFGFLNYKGEEVLPAHYSKAHDFKNGFARVRFSKGYNYIDMEGERISDDHFYMAEDFEGKYARVRTSSGAGILANNGKLILSDALKIISLFNNNQTALIKRKDGKTYFIDQLGRAFIPTGFDHAIPFRNGIAPVRINGKWGIISRTGQMIRECEYGKISEFAFGKAVVAIEENCGLLDLNGNELLPVNYQNILYAGNGIYRVNDFGRMGYIRKDGKWLWRVQ